MRRFLFILLAASILMSCVSAPAETNRYEELGIAFDFSAIQEQSENYPFLNNYGVIYDDPYVASIEVIYTDLSKDIIDAIQGIVDETEDDAEYDDYIEFVRAFTTSIGEITVTNAESLAEVGYDEAMMEKCGVTEFATQGDYHYYFITYPADRLIALYDGAEDTGDYEVSPQEMKVAALADIDMVQSELLELLQSTDEFFEPVNPTADLIGQVIEFESVDLDGNAVRSADLFKDNKITMVNLWGTWCINCMNEMGELAEIHKRMQEKGCGIVGVEYETDPIEQVADTARKVFEDNGITYPNVVIPEGNPIFDQVTGYPFSFFVDSEGRILTYPIRGAAVDDYETTFEKLLAGEAVEGASETGSTENESGEYRVFVYDTEGNPVKGVIVQLCDDDTCSFQKTDADGVATFQVEAPTVFDVHVAKVPEGYVSTDEAFKTLDTFSDVNIFIGKAE